MNDILGKKIEVGIDAIELSTGIVSSAGYIAVLDYMGSEDDIANAARTSYSPFQAYRSNKGLLSYLMKHGHTSPFEMAEIKIQLECPIFVARQLVRTRTANINEFSARYSQMPDKFFMPKIEDLAGQDPKNKQQRLEVADQNIDPKNLDLFKNAYKSYDIYLKLLEEGVSREIARSVLPLSVFTRIVWKIDLHNLLRFLSQRAFNAQKEIKLYAKILLEIVEHWMPHIYHEFMNQETGIKFSASEVKALKNIPINIENLSSLRGHFASEGSYDSFVNKVSQLSSDTNGN